MTPAATPHTLARQDLLFYQTSPIRGGLFVDLDANPEAAVLADAAFTLAAVLATGVAAAAGTPADDRAAAALLFAAAAAGSREATLGLAQRFESGRGVPASLEEALRRARLAADDTLASLEEAGGTGAHVDPLILRLRWMDGNYRPRGEDSDADFMVQFEKDTAARGDTVSHRTLGYRLLTGQGLPRDVDAAAHEFDIAAAQGDG